MFIIIPQNTWHQFNAPDGVTLMTTTPQPTEHIEDEFPPEDEIPEDAVLEDGQELFRDRAIQQAKAAALQAPAAGRSEKRRCLKKMLLRCKLL